MREQFQRVFKIQFVSYLIVQTIDWGEANKDKAGRLWTAVTMHYNPKYRIFGIVHRSSIRFSKRCVRFFSIPDNVQKLSNPKINLNYHHDKTCLYQWSQRR